MSTLIGILFVSTYSYVSFGAKIMISFVNFQHDYHFKGSGYIFKGVAMSKLLLHPS